MLDGLKGRNIGKREYLRLASNSGFVSKADIEYKSGSNPKMSLKVESKNGLESKSVLASRGGLASKR